MVDDGIPFNPLGVETPDTDLPLEEREIGGLGIHLVRRMMDKVSYRRRIDKNVITVYEYLEVDNE
jgi:anti-sigma regulatory factor (Ser/Thr protein kinase)